MDFTSSQHAPELRLSLTSSMPENPTNHTNKLNLRSDHPLNDQPSLILSLSGDSCSSFSNASLKRERSDESDRAVENMSTSCEEDDQDGGHVMNGKKKLRLTKAQSGLLEEAFKLHTTLNPKQKHELARDLKLRPRQVEVWFQNRRARTKLKQTEVDYGYLKKCCKILTDENQNLRQEVQQLKLQKGSQPAMYMQLPAATLAMCPSCEHIGDTKKAMAPKPYFFNPFTSSPAG